MMLISLLMNFGQGQYILGKFVDISSHSSKSGLHQKDKMLPESTCLTLSVMIRQKRLQIFGNNVEQTP